MVAAVVVELRGADVDEIGAWISGGDQETGPVTRVEDEDSAAVVLPAVVATAFGPALLVLRSVVFTKVVLGTTLLPSLVLRSLVLTLLMLTMIVPSPVALLDEVN